MDGSVISRRELTTVEWAINDNPLSKKELYFIN